MGHFQREFGSQFDVQGGFGSQIEQDNAIVLQTKVGADIPIEGGDEGGINASQMNAGGMHLDDLIDSLDNNLDSQEQDAVIKFGFHYFKALYDEAMLEYNLEMLQNKKKEELGTNVDGSPSSREESEENKLSPKGGSPSIRELVEKNKVPLKGRSPSAVRKRKIPGRKLAVKKETGDKKKSVDKEEIVENPAKIKNKSEAELRAEYADFIVDSSYEIKLNVVFSWVEWKNLMIHIVKNYKPPKPVIFDADVSEWSFNNSLFFNDGDLFIKKPRAVKFYGYLHRDKLSRDAACILNDWWIQVKLKKKINDEVVFKHNQADLWCSVGALKYLMDPKLPVSSEFVEMVINLIQFETPLKHPWFFISSYLTIGMHEYDEKLACQALPHLFGPQFDTVKWLFYSHMQKQNHWMLFVVDIHSVKLLYYTSVGDLNMYFEYFWHSIKWLMEFRAWRTSNPQWKDVDVIDEDCPKQISGSLDCVVFLLRYVYHIITETPMNFTQDDISKERIVLVMKLVTHPNNTKQRVKK